MTMTRQGKHHTVRSDLTGLTLLIITTKQSVTFYGKMYGKVQYHTPIPSHVPVNWVKNKNRYNIIDHGCNTFSIMSVEGLEDFIIVFTLTERFFLADHYGLNLQIFPTIKIRKKEELLGALKKLYQNSVDYYINFLNLFKKLILVHTNN